MRSRQKTIRAGLKSKVFFNRVMKLLYGIRVEAIIYQGIVAVANRIFETRIYNLFLSEDEVSSHIYATGSMDKNQFIQSGHLNMDLVLKKFMDRWNELYSSADVREIHSGETCILEVVV